VVARQDLSCSALLCPSVPPETPGRSSTRSDSECCLLPSLLYERLGPPKHLSAESMTRLLRSLIVAAHRLAPLSFEGFDTPLGSVGTLLPAGVCYRRSGAYPDGTFSRKNTASFKTHQR
jgi:hypothetical protein